MKITDVEAFILESPRENRPPTGSDEAHGVKHCLLLKVTTDEGLIGWSDVETAPHVAAAVVSAPQSGAGLFEGLRALVLGEDPFEVERLWDKVYRGTIYYGRRGVAMQVLSGFDIACHDLMGRRPAVHCTSCSAVRGVIECAPMPRPSFARLRTRCGAHASFIRRAALPR